MNRNDLVSSRAPLIFRNCSNYSLYSSLKRAVPYNSHFHYMTTTLNTHSPIPTTMLKNPPGMKPRPQKTEAVATAVPSEETKLDPKKKSALQPTAAA